MRLDQEVLDACRLSSWTLRQAAFYVHNVNPNSYTKDILDQQTNFPPALTYNWLLKERAKYRLTPSNEIDGEEVYSPGSIMRHLRERGRSFVEEVYTAYDNHFQGINQTGPTTAQRKQKRKYQEAARYLKDLHPGLTNAEIADVLEQLPTRLPNHKLLRFSKGTLKNWTSEAVGSGKRGRPKDSEKYHLPLDQIDWEEMESAIKH
jgi:hypothetical protein